jgi:hypothetical protein
MVCAVEVEIYTEGDEAAASVNGDFTGFRPSINSMWADNPPKIDGFFSYNEWGNAQILIESPIHTFVFFKNDMHFLYVCVDAANGVGGDYTEEPDDHCLLEFHNPENGCIFSILINGDVGTFSVDGLKSAIGFGKSPNSVIPHKIYEFKLPFLFKEYEWAKVCKDVDFASPTNNGASIPYDWNSGQPRYNTWPSTVVNEDYSTYGILTLACPPVGGELHQNNISTMGTGITAVILTVAVTVGLAYNKKKLT